MAQEGPKDANVEALAAILRLKYDPNSFQNVKKLEIEEISKSLKNHWFFYVFQGAELSKNDEIHTKKQLSKHVAKKW